MRPKRGRAGAPTFKRLHNGILARRAAAAAKKAAVTRKRAMATRKLTAMRAARAARKRMTLKKMRRRGAIRAANANAAKPAMKTIANRIANLRKAGFSNKIAPKVASKMARAPERRMTNYSKMTGKLKKGLK